MSREFLILLGDVVESQTIPDRDAFDQSLRALVTDINAQTSDLYADVRVLKGVDEIAGVLTSVAAAIRVQTRLVDGIHPHGIRVVVVAGAIDIGLDRDSVAEMDGPGFAAADETMQQLAGDEQYFAMDVHDPVIDTLVSDEVNLLTMLKHDWSPHQHHVVQRYTALGTQQAVAAELDVSPQSISQTMRRARAKQLLQIETRLHETVTSYDDQLAITPAQ